MAITTLDGWFASAKQKVFIQKPGITTSQFIPFSLWTQTGYPGAGNLSVGNTSSGAVITDSDAGAPLLTAFQAGATGYLSAARMRSNGACTFWLYDRIFGVGELSTASTGTTTLTGQPSYSGRVPNGNDYGNLEIYVEITAVPTGASPTVTVTYTNEAGTTGRTTSSSGSLLNHQLGRLTALPLQAGDKGVQKIESVIVGGTASAAGRFNVLVARRLAVFDTAFSGNNDIQAWDMTGGVQVFDTSALWLVAVSYGGSSPTVFLDCDIING